MKDTRICKILYDKDAFCVIKRCSKEADMNCCYECRLLGRGNPNGCFVYTNLNIYTYNDNAYFKFLMLYKK
jgi:hypothetical protein